MPDQAEELLARYAQALRRRDLDATMECYTDDAVVQAPGAPTAEGPAVRTLYQQIFSGLVLDISFTVDTTVRADDGTLAVFTHSNGVQTDLQSGAKSDGSNREAFVLRQDSGSLKVMRYLFNVTG